MGVLKVLLVLAAIVAVGTAYTCYSCSSLTDSKCKDSPSTTCTGDHCVKVVAGDTVTRSCATSCTEVGDKKAGTFCCTKDNCNGAGNLRMAPGALAALLGAWVVLKAAF